MSQNFKKAKLNYAASVSIVDVRATPRYVQCDRTTRLKRFQRTCKLFSSFSSRLKLKISGLGCAARTRKRCDFMVRLARISFSQNLSSAIPSSTLLSSIISYKNKISAKFDLVQRKCAKRALFYCNFVLFSNTSFNNGTFCAFSKC